jgi:GNAT superfamily N-acetyltransferase
MIANSPRTIVPAPGGRWYDFRDHGDVALNADLPRLRSLLGATAVLWAGADGVTVEPRGWTALSGAKAVDYNVVVCHDASAGADLEAGVNRIAAAGVPAVMMVAGKALGEVQKLIELGWVCIGSVPLMLLELHPSDPAPATPVVRRLDGTQLDAARGIVDEVFGIGPELSLVAIPRDAADRAGQSVWGSFDDHNRLVSCLVAVRAQEIVAIWSMATTAPARGRGHGAAVLRAALAAEVREGARAALLYSSRAGEAFYSAFGYRELERWQLWSRPRWVLGRA